MPDTTPHVPTDKSRKKVEQMAAVGVPQEDISKVIGIDSKTLRKYYREELDTSLIKANAQVGGALFEKARKGDTSAMIWWEKTRAGKSDKNKDDDAKDEAILGLLGIINGQTRGIGKDT